MKEIKKHIIIDLKTKKALYGIDDKTLTFSTKEIATEVALQFFYYNTDFIIVEITI